jgi:hypothetical protein
MANDDVQLSAAIKFETDTASVSNAKKALDEVKSGADGAAAAAGKVKPAAGADQEFKKVGASASATFQAVNVAAAAAEGNMMGVGQAVTSLAGGFPKLAAALGPIGLIVGAFTVLYNIIEKVRDAREKFEAGIRAIKLGNLESQIRRNVEAYDAESKAIQRVADARQQLSDIEQGKDDARLRSELAALELEQAKEKAALNPDDDIGSRKIDLKYAQQRAGLQEASDGRRAERESTQISAAASDEATKIKEAQKLKDDLIEQFSRLGAQYSHVVSSSRTKSDDWYERLIPGRNDAFQASARESGDIAARMKSVSEAIRKADDDERSAKAKKTGLEGMRSVADIDARTLGLVSGTRKTNDAMAAGSIARDEAKQIDGLFAELNTVTTGGDNTFNRWAEQQIAAKQNENALTADFMRTMLELSKQNVQQLQAGVERARRQGG